MNLNKINEYVCIKTKLVYNIVYMNNNIIYVRKLGCSNTLGKMQNHPIIEISLSNFKKCFEIY